MKKEFDRTYQYNFNLIRFFNQFQYLYPLILQRFNKLNCFLIDFDDFIKQLFLRMVALIMNFIT